MPASSLLVEIGTEELPLVSLHLFYAQGVENIQKLLAKSRLDFKGVRVEGTPRRLAFFVEDLAAKQREERTLLLGPASDRAYDANGKPTEALAGFLKAQKASLEEVRIQETPRGRYVAIEKVKKGAPTQKLLPRLIPEILSSFSFPKTMRWEKTGFRFPRPIRWIVALYGRGVVSFSLAGVRSGRVSRGHRFLSPRSLPIPRADWGDYVKRLRAHRVVLSLAARESLIQKGLERKFRQRDLDPDLVRETAQLVEEPFLIQGKFSGTYRDLPEEVLATCMKKYQKVFACRDETGHLMNRFVAILNGRRSGLGRIQRDYENVLESRLRDAHYFYDEDTREPLTKKVNRLGELLFLGRLGTMRERVERLRELARELVRISGHEELEEKIDRVAFLSKADLVTQMVGEFPGLQGIMGREYAEAAGEAPEVAQAIGEQYLPKNLAEDYSALAKKLGLLGALFGIADRMDLLVGAFGIGLDPTGSEDPYALRRSGGGLIKLARAFRLHFPLSELIRKSRSLYGEKGDLSPEALTSKLQEFLKERVAFELQAKAGTKPYEILEGILKSSFEDVQDVLDRFQVLWGMASQQPQIFFRTSKVVERTSNILKGVQEKLDSVDPNLFQESLERELFKLLQEKGPKLRASLEKKDYEAVTRLYGETFFDPVHHFFEAVLVNVEDPLLRRNRQALMREINVLYTDEVADLSCLSQVRE